MLKRSSSLRRFGQVTLHDVAAAAGVSAMTVSRVINKNAEVRPSTRDRVARAIDELGYTPNGAASSLAAGSMRRVALLYCNPSPSYLSEFLVGALDSARTGGWHLLVQPYDSIGMKGCLTTARRLKDARVRGVVLTPPLSELAELQKALQSAGLPVVTSGARPPSSTRLNVRIDDFRAAKQITQHLISLGHQDIGFIKGSGNQAASHEREKGYLAALREAGRSLGQVCIERGDFSYRSGLDAARKLLIRAPKLTAIFASNDDMAAAVIGVAHCLGLSVPNDLSVVGFDDTAVATTVWPELTTVRQPVSLMAQTCFELLFADIAKRRRNPQRTIDKVLDHQIIVRGSTGPLGNTIAKANVPCSEIKRSLSRQIGATERCSMPNWLQSSGE